MTNDRSAVFVFGLIIACFLALGTSAHTQTTATNSGAWSDAATWDTPPVNSNSVVVAGNHTVSFGAGDAYTGGSSVGTGLVVENRPVIVGWARRSGGKQPAMVPFRHRLWAGSPGQRL